MSLFEFVRDAMLEKLKQDYLAGKVEAKDLCERHKIILDDANNYVKTWKEDKEINLE